MTAYIVVYRKRYSDKDCTIGHEFWRVRNAESYALLLFNRFQLNRVMVVKTGEGGCETVYLQESNCKHVNIQQEFASRTGEVSKRCIDCGEPMKKLEEGICIKLD